MEMKTCFRELVQTLETKNMLVYWAQEAAAHAQRRIDQIGNMSPPLCCHVIAISIIKKPDGMGRSSGSVQLANEEFIYCGLMKQSKPGVMQHARK